MCSKCIFNMFKWNMSMSNNRKMVLDGNKMWSVKLTFYFRFFFISNSFFKVQISSFNGSCIYDAECDGTLQLICNNSKCICAGATPYGTWFWNGTQCGQSFHLKPTANIFFQLNFFFFLVLCPLGWLNYEIYCYYNSQSAATWNNSRSYCQKFGADLLVIRSQAEFNFIKPQAAAIIGNRKRAFIGYYTLSSSSRSLFLLFFFRMKIVVIFFDFSLFFSGFIFLARFLVTNIHRKSS